MKREVVQDFLNLPGIAGVALIDRRSRPYFCGVDQSLNFQQKEALVQGIQQVVETTPTGFEFFEFQFTGTQVYIYKLDHGIILLVLTGSELVQQTYNRAIEQLKTELQKDTANAIATFRLLAGNITLSNQNYWKRRPEAASPVVDPKLLSAPIIDAPQATNNRNGTRHEEILEPIPALDKASPPSPPTDLASQEELEDLVAEDLVAEDLVDLVAEDLIAEGLVVESSISLKEVLSALNHLSQFTTQYLGTTVITNYWKTSRPAIEWLDNFQVDRSAQFTFVSPAPTSVSQTMTSEQHQWLREWIALFIARCSKVIRDFPLLIEQRALDDRQKYLLLNKT